MSRAWFRAAGEKVLIAFVGAFLAALLASPAGIAQLSTLHAAAIAGLGAAVAALYASLGPLQRGAAATTRAARRAITRPRAAADAAGITRGRQLHIEILLNVKQAAVTSADLMRWAKPLDSQVTAFCHAWGLLKPRLSIRTYKDPAMNARAGAGTKADLQIVILDNSDQADALGYHDETAAGLPYARVFALDCEKYGVAVSSCVSHELLEAIADLACDRWAQAADGRLWALEVCDPVENDTYDVNGVALSNYVTPAFFDPRGHAPYDALGKLTKPFTMTPSGYGIVMSGGNVSQVYGKKLAGVKAWNDATKMSPLSRTARRLNRR